MKRNKITRSSLDLQAHRLQWQVARAPLLASILILQSIVCLSANAQDTQSQSPQEQAGNSSGRQTVYPTNPECDPATGFRLSATQNQMMPPPQVGVSQPQFTNPVQVPYPVQQNYAGPIQGRFAHSTQIPPPPPVPVFSAAAREHSGPVLLSDQSPLAYDLTICQDDPNFHPPYLVPHPEVLNTPGFRESPQNVRLWQAWADRVAMASWTEWRRYALPEFGCAEIDIKLNRDGSFQAKRGVFKYYAPDPSMPVEQAPFLRQLNPFLKHLQDTRIFRIPDGIYLDGSQTVEFQLQIGVRRKDRANPYSWCGFMKDWQWWTGTGLQVYHRIECELQGLGKR